MRQRSFRVRLATAPLKSEITDALLDEAVAVVESSKDIAAPIISADVAVRTLTLTASVDTDRGPQGALDAVERVLDAVFHRIMPGEEHVVVEAMIEDEASADDRQELVAGSEIARRLGYTREWIRQMATMPGRFPTPVAVVGTYRVWRWGDVVDWARANDRSVVAKTKKKASGSGRGKVPA